jgi:hypothetical protein
LLLPETGDRCSPARKLFATLLLAKLSLLRVHQA